MKTYTGIGSRNTPPQTLIEIQRVAEELWGKGYTLRSGKAGGADRAFQLGVQEALLHSDKFTPPKEAEIYIPWKKFKGGEGLWNCWDISDWPDECYDIAKSIHPAWDKCSQGARKLHARNVCQVLGKDLESPSDFVLFCAEEVNGKVKGGTATAVNLAREYGIPTINMYFIRGKHWYLELDEILEG